MSLIQKLVLAAALFAPASSIAERPMYEAEVVGAYLTNFQHNQELINETMQQKGRLYSIVFCDEGMVPDIFQSNHLGRKFQNVDKQAHLYRTLDEAFNSEEFALHKRAKNIAPPGTVLGVLEIDVPKGDFTGFYNLRGKKVVDGTGNYELLFTGEGSR